MAYKNGVFRIDPVNGNNNLPAALSGVSFSWNSGTSKMRGTYTNHGLVTGQLINITGSTSLNDRWLVTVIDANNFDLDDSTNVSNQTGTVQPYRGATWSDAAKSASHFNTVWQMGDEYRFPRTPIQNSGVSCTWTFNGAALTHNDTSLVRLLNAATATTGWVASTNITLGTTSARKYGSASLALTPNASFGSGKMAYHTFSSTLDLSSYQYLNFWLSATTNLTANIITVRLCSDSTGDTVVWSGTVSQHLGTTQRPIVFESATGFGSSINSISIHAATGIGTISVRINDITVSNGLNLRSLIGPQGKVEYCINAMDSSSIWFGNPLSNSGSNSLYGYASSTENLYYANSLYLQRDSTATFAGILGDINATTANNVSVSGSPPVQPIKFIGGFDTSTDTVSSGSISAAYVSLYQTTVQGYFQQTPAASLQIENFAFINYNSFSFVNPSISNNCRALTFKNCVFTGSGASLTGIPANKKAFINCSFTTSTNGFFLTSFLNELYSNSPNLYFEGCRFHTNHAALSNSNVVYKNCSFAVRSATDFFVGNLGSSLKLSSNLLNCTFINPDNHFPTSAVSIPGCVNCSGYPVSSSQYYANLQGRTEVFWQTTEKQTSGAPGAYQIKTTGSSAVQDTTVPLEIEVAQVPSAASSSVTCKLWVKKGHAANVKMSLGVDHFASTATFSSTPSEVFAANNTNWQEIEVTANVNSAGVVVFLLRFYFDIASSATDSYFTPVSVS